MERVPLESFEDRIKLRDMFLTLTSPPQIDNDGTDWGGGRGSWRIEIK
jgi:hypothetical protein